MCPTWGGLLGAVSLASVGCRYGVDDEGDDVGDPHEDLMGLLVAHTDAWNSHDLDRLMDLFDEECAFLAAGGEEACGTTYSGKGAVRSAFAEIYENVPDALWLDGKHSVLDVHRGVSEWRMVGTVASGGRLEINGCDFLTFRDGRILVKDSYTKDRSPIPQ